MAAAPAAARGAEVTLEVEPPIPHVEPDPAYTLAVEAGSGERNKLVVFRDGDAMVVRERGVAPLAPGDRCSAATPTEVRCALPGSASHLSVFVDLGDGADALTLGPLAGVELSEVLGGSGGDVVAGGEGADLLLGQSGNDWLAGLGGGDRLDGGAGNDLLEGGAGRDLASYATRREDITVDLAAQAGGGPGEVDRFTDIEDASGGRGADVLLGSDGDNLLYGGPEGPDRAEGRAGDDSLSARRAIGGPGDDHIDGKVVRCGRGRDVTTRFRFAPVGPYGTDCEQIVGFYFVISHPQRTRSGLRFEITCPIRSCRGTFWVKDEEGVLARRSYSLRGEGFGGTGPVQLRFPFSRKPASRLGRLEVTGKALARDSFRIRLR